MGALSLYIVSIGLSILAIEASTGCDVPHIDNGYFETSIHYDVYFRGFPFGSKVRFYCNTGYKLDGKQELICLRFGWSGKFPICKVDPCSYIRCKPPKVCEVNRYGKPECVCPDSHYSHDGYCAEYCSNPPAISYGGHNGIPPYKYPKKIQYYCNRYYKLIGEDSYMCQKDGTWHPKPPPKCVKRDPCDLIKCIKPKVCRVNPNGKPECVCPMPYYGYKHECINYCSAPPGLPHGSHDGNGPYVYPDVVKYMCDEMYDLVGDDQYTCQKSGKWHPTPPPSCVKRNPCDRILCIKPKVCRVNPHGKPECVCPRPFYSYKHECINYCSAPPGLPHGSHNGNAPYVYPDVVNYMCDKMYDLVGDDQYTCQKSGKWHPTPPPSCVKKDPCDRIRCIKPKVCRVNPHGKPECVCPKPYYGYKHECINYCSAPPVLPHGSHNGIRPYVYPDVVKYTCDEMYHLVGNDQYTCQKSGKWHPTPPPCCAERIPVIKCLKPHIMNGGVEPNQAAYNVCDVVKFYCDKGYYLDGSSEAVCKSNGKFSSIPECKVSHDVCKGSCYGRCRESSDYGRYCCQCDAICKYLGTCCTDHYEECSFYY